MTTELKKNNMERTSDVNPASHDACVRLEARDCTEELRRGIAYVCFLFFDYLKMSHYRKPPFSFQKQYFHWNYINKNNNNNNENGINLAMSK